MPEVYSRITGYYRPVQNWNDGKAQEFRDRKLYDIGHSRLTHTGPRKAYSNMDAAIEATTERGCCEPAQVLMKPESEEARADRRSGNPNARATAEAAFENPGAEQAKALLDRAGVKYAAVNAADAQDLTAKYGVKQAPTLVVPTGEGFEKLRGVSDIKGWLMQTATR